MDYLLTIILVVLSIFFRKSKVVATLFFLFMWSLWGWNSWNGDYDAYKFDYDNSDWFFDSNYELGYVYMLKAFSFIGFEFQTYMICLSFLVLSSILAFCLKYSKYPAMYSMLYFIIFIMEFVFTRNFIVHSILIFAFFLVFKKVKYYKIWFVLLIIVASTIHSTAFVSLIFTLSFYKPKFLNLKKIIPLILISLLASIFLFQSVVLQYLGGSYLSKYQSYKTDGGFSNVFFAHLIIVIIVYIFIQKLLKSKNITENHRRIFIIVSNLNVLSLFILCIYYQIPYFSRILRFIYTFDLVFLLHGLYLVKNNPVKFKLKIIFIAVYSSALILFYKSTLSLTLYPLYKCNIIWGQEEYIPDFDYDK